MHSVQRRFVKGIGFLWFDSLPFEYVDFKSAINMASINIPDRLPRVALKEILDFFRGVDCGSFFIRLSLPCGCNIENMQRTVSEGLWTNGVECNIRQTIFGSSRTF